MGEVVGNAVMWLRKVRGSFPQEKHLMVDNLCDMCNRHASLSPLQQNAVRLSLLSIQSNEVGVAALLSLATYINTCREENI